VAADTQPALTDFASEIAKVRAQSGAVPDPTAVYVV